MKLFPRLILAPSIVALTMLTGCPDKPVPPSNTGQLGDQCDAEHDCMPGLLCENGICRKVCQDNSDCPNDSSCLDERCVKNTTPRSKNGESCDLKILCESGLECLDGICQKPCKNDTDCQDNYTCQNKKCVLKASNPRGKGEACDEQNKCAEGLVCEGNICRENTEIVTETPIKLPAGATLTNIAGKASSNRYKVQVLGGSMAGSAQDSTHEVKVNDGSWK